MWDTVEDVGTSSLVMYSCGPLRRDKQSQDIQLEHKYSSTVPILDVSRKTCQKQRTIGRADEWGSGISVLIAGHDDDDDDNIGWCEAKLT